MGDFKFETEEQKKVHAFVDMTNISPTSEKNVPLTDVWISGCHQKSDVSDVNNCAYIYQRRRDTRKVGRTRTKSLYYSLTAILTMHNLRESWE